MEHVIKLLLTVKTLKNFHIAILDKAGLLRGTVYYETRSNLKFKSRAGSEDMPEIVVVVSGDEYHMEKVTLTENPTIVDIGAHIGSFSLLCFKLFGSASRIISFEPDKNNYKLFLENLKINNAKNVESENIAISNYHGNGFLNIESMNTDAYYLEVNESKKINCKVNTLYSEASRRKIKKIDLLKMDIEGGEYALFFDDKTYNFLKKKVNYIFMEYHNLDKKNNINSLRKKFRNDFKVIHSNKSVLTLKNKSL